MQEKIPNNLPRDELMRHAQQTLDLMGGGYCYFKFTCVMCGARVLLQEPNVLYERGECCACGNVQEIIQGGYMFATSKLSTDKLNKEG